MNKEYDWVVVGGGIAGITTAEILSRNGLKVLLLEKSGRLCAETSKGFHEWWHVGALYTLIPDRLKTLKYITGALDDLFTYYSGFRGMNLEQSDNGLIVNKADSPWYNNKFINFKYRIKGRKLFIPWLYGVARSSILIERLSNHDWLRKRAGCVEYMLNGIINNIIIRVIKLLTLKSKFYNIKTPDIGINSRNMIEELVQNCLQNGVKIITDTKAESIKKNENQLYEINSTGEKYFAKNCVLASGHDIKRFFNDVNVKTSYAPICVAKNIRNTDQSFVELDFYPRNCINLLVKEDNYGLIGGISFNNKDKCDDYINKVIKEHKKYNNNLIPVKKYIGEKHEIILKKEKRNYIYHILQNSDGIWAVIPGKFTLAFSMAPEFYRTVYKKNSITNINTSGVSNKATKIIDKTYWQEERDKEYGIN